MPRFYYQAIDKIGLEKTGIIRSSDLQKATELLGKKSLIVTSIHILPKEKNLISSFFEKIKNKNAKISSEILLSFSQQLTILLESSIQLLDAMEVIRSQMRNIVMKNALEIIIDNLKNGAKLSDQMSRFPNIFDDFYVNMVVCGEKSGHLEKTLPKVCDFLEKKIKTKKNLQTILIYPSILFFMTVTVGYFFLVFVIPKFHSTLFENSSIEIPWFTSFIFKVSSVLKTQIHFIVLLPILLFVLIKNTVAKNKRLRLFVENLVLKLPYIGDFFKNFTLNIFCYSFGILLENGIPLLVALELTRKLMRFRAYRLVITKASGNLYNGLSISESFTQNTELFPSIFLNLIKTGEETGKLVQILNKMSEQFEFEYQQLMKKMLTFIEPFLMIILAFFVGIIIISLFSPLSQLLQDMKF